MHGYAGQIQHSVRASFASTAKYEQLDAHNGLAFQNPTAVDNDFSARPGEVRGGEVAPPGPVVVHEPHVGVMWDASGTIRLVRCDRRGSVRIDATDGSSGGLEHPVRERWSILPLRAFRRFGRDGPLGDGPRPEAAPRASRRWRGSSGVRPSPRKG